jgi:uncharacterized protein YbjQ (UPF0145 family)
VNADSVETVVKIAIPAVLVTVGLFAGRVAERRHLASLTRREAALKDMMCTNLRSYPGGVGGDGRAELVMSHAVISSDYFKTFVAGLVNIIGGELKTLQTLMDRARREATVRLLEDAKAKGYNAVCNVRYDAVAIAKVEQKKKNPMTMATILASGTAYRTR